MSAVHAWALHLSLGTGLAAQEPVTPADDPAPAAAPGSAGAPVTYPFGEGPTAVPYDPRTSPPTGEQPPEPRRPTFVFAFLPSLTMGISPLPSANVALFAGGRLPGRPWALGYQLTLSSGLAERYGIGLLTHRHHLTAMRSFGATDRGFASVGGGAAFLWNVPVAEAEGRLGFRFGSKRYGVLAALVRVGWNIGMREQAPMPQFGLVVGFAFL